MEIFILLALMIGMMWFITSRGKKRQAAEREKLNNVMVPGVSVMTIGGFLGRIVDIDGDVITLESPSGVETIWLRSAIKEVKEPPFAAVHDEDEVADDVVVPDDASTLGVADPTVEDDRREPGHDPRP